MKKIVQTPEKVLFEKALSLKKEEIQTNKVQKIIKEMIEALSSL